MIEHGSLHLLAPTGTRPRNITGTRIRNFISQVFHVSRSSLATWDSIRIRKHQINRNHSKTLCFMINSLTKINLTEQLRLHSALTVIDFCPAIQRWSEVTFQYSGYAKQSTAVTKPNIRLDNSVQRIEAHVQSYLSSNLIFIISSVSTKNLSKLTLMHPCKTKGY